jgi:hypothetical protein
VRKKRHKSDGVPEFQSSALNSKLPPRVGIEEKEACKEKFERVLS